VLPLSKIEDIRKSSRIRIRFIAAIIEPMIVSQFLDEGGNFIGIRLKFQME
jgi:hypothetical protein